MTRARCTFTVFSLMPSSKAICLFSIPVTTRANTSASRGVSVLTRSLLDLRGAALGAPILHVLRHRPLNGVQQVLGLEGLGEKIDRPALHGLDAHRDVDVTRDEHDRHSSPPRCQRLLQFEPGEAGHPHIQHQAARTAVPFAREELSGRGERLDRVPGRRQQSRHALPHGGVIVHDEDHRSRHGTRHRCHDNKLG
jgi:hypothetical protein